MHILEPLYFGCGKPGKPVYVRKTGLARNLLRELQMVRVCEKLQGSVYVVHMIEEGLPHFLKKSKELMDGLPGCH